MKKIIILCALISTNIWSLSELESKHGITFELRNHDTYPIRISLLDPVINKIIFQDITVPASKGKMIPSYQKSVDINQGFLRLIVHYKNPATARQATKSYTFAPGKTLFLAWEKKELRPQKGIFGKTQSGMSLKNNLTLKDILSRDHQEERADEYWLNIID